MVEGAKGKIEALAKTGKGFTYENFSTKGKYGYPDATTPAWVAWQSRVSGAIKGLFGEKSAPYEMLRNGLLIQVIGNGPDKFNQAHSYFMGALEAAQEVLEADAFGELIDAPTSGPLASSNKVFIVHGRDDVAKGDLEVLLGELGLDPIVLHRQPDGGKTIIEKFEHFADVGYAFILMTPDEIAYLVSEEDKPDDKRLKEKRARPNVIFEFGYFVGRLGRQRTCCLYRGDVVVPSDLNGLVYKRFEKSVEEVGYSIIKDLKAAGYKLR